MSRPPWGSDLISLLRGLSRIGSAAAEIRSQEATKAWATSSIRPLVEKGASNLQETITRALQDPQLVQAKVSKGTSEVLGRISLVAEGIKAYSTQTAPLATTDLSEVIQETYNPVYDPNVRELSIEDVMMQEALSGHEDLEMQYNNKSGADVLVGIGGVADAVVTNAGDVKGEIAKKLKGFEPLLDISQFKESEITEEQLQVVDEKVLEMGGAIYDSNLSSIKGTEGTKPVDEVLEGGRKENIDSQEFRVQELSIEGVVMQDALSNHEDILMEAVEKMDATDIKSEGVHKIEEFDRLINSLQLEEREITEEHLQAVNKKLMEVQDIAFGHDLKIFREVEDEKHVAEALNKIVEEKASHKGATVEKTKLVTELEETLQNAPKENLSNKVEQTEASDVHEKVMQVSDVETSSFLSEKDNAKLNLDTTIAQVAKSVDIGASEKTIRDFDVEVQIEPTIEAQPVRGTTEFLEPDSDYSGSKSPSGISNTSAALSGVGLAAATAATTAATMPGVAAAAATTTVAATSKSVSTKQEKKNISVSKPKPKLLGRKPLAKDKPKSTLAENAQARKVPHSRLGRMLTFGSLAAGLGAGTIAEMTRRQLGVNKGQGSGSLLDASPFLTEANAKRIVDTLCKVRGAALKLGQMLSIQDSSLINPQVQKIFERVRQSADFMPLWQLEKVIEEQLGQDWRSKVSFFDEKPFAAASIGQVHLVTLQDGRSAAMKIQYPGVAEGIESDINNLMSTLKVANIIPEGMYVDKVIEVAKRELGWECDYIREAACTNQYRELVRPYPEFYVPEVIPDLCTQQVFTSELIEGIAVDKCIDMDQDTRNFITEKILHLCLLELFVFGFMQTDPNWSNFFYNADTEQLALLDFGACRAYDKSFVDKYIHIIHGAATKDREKILHYSQELGFLTGYEAKVMVDAHIDAIMILGEAFQEDEPFQFGSQDTTHRIQHLVPVMLSHRMCAPPEESYSLHRKLSGAFLLCAKLNGIVRCKPLFDDVYKAYKFGGTWEEFHSSLKLSF